MSSSKDSSADSSLPKTPFINAFAFVTSSSLYQSVVGSVPAAPTKPSVDFSKLIQPKQTVPATVKPPPGRYVILVNPRQKGNPLLKHIRNVAWVFESSIVPDYVLGDQGCALFLSIKYHLLHPKYLYSRMGELQGKFKVRVLLLLVDQEDNERPLLQISSIAVVNKWTVVCAWSNLEAARYLETFKAYEHHSANLIKEKVDKDPSGQFANFLTTIRSVNKTDVSNLASHFGSLKNISNASIEELAVCPGIGTKKATRIYKAFRTPFNPTKTSD